MVRKGGFPYVWRVSARIFIDFWLIIVHFCLFRHGEFLFIQVGPES